MPRNTYLQIKNIIGRIITLAVQKFSQNQLYIPDFLKNKTLLYAVQHKLWLSFKKSWQKNELTALYAPTTSLTLAYCHYHYQEVSGILTINYSYKTHFFTLKIESEVGVVSYLRVKQNFRKKLPTNSPIIVKSCAELSLIKKSWLDDLTEQIKVWLKENILLNWFVYKNKQ